MPCRFTASAGEAVFLFRAPIGSDARKPAVGRIEEAARYNYVKGLNPAAYFDIFDVVRLDTVWLDKT